MPSAKQHGPIETMQVIAWCAEVQRASGMTLGKLKKQCFEKSRAPKFEFKLFSTGGRLPDDKTLALIENTYPGTREIFDIGPDKRPLWAFLSDECDEDLCLEALDDWLFTGFTARDVASVPKAEQESILAQLKSSSLQVKTGLAWKKMVGPNGVDVSFERFDAGEESHCLWEAAEELDALLNEFEASGVKIEKPVNVEALLKSPLLDDEQRTLSNNGRTTSTPRRPRWTTSSASSRCVASQKAGANASPKPAICFSASALSSTGCFPSGTSVAA